MRWDSIVVVAVERGPPDVSYLGSERGTVIEFYDFSLIIPLIT